MSYEQIANIKNLLKQLRHEIQRQNNFANFERVQVLKGYKKRLRQRLLILQTMPKTKESSIS